MTKEITQTKGLTLVELIITLAIAGVLVALATPNFSATIQNNRMATQINELQASLSLARSEAIKRNNNVTMCQSSSGSSCTGNWQDGWIIFVDNNFDGNVDGEEVLRVHGALAGANTLTFSQTGVIYANNGLARGGANGTFTLCDTRGAENAKGLIIGLSGRPYLVRDSDSNGIPNDGDDLDLECSS